MRDLRAGAEVHRTVRKYVQTYIRPGMSMIDICERLENKTRQLVVENGVFHLIDRTEGRNRIPDWLLPEPRRCALHPQRWRQDCAAVR